MDRVKPVPVSEVTTLQFLLRLRCGELFRRRWGMGWESKLAGRDLHEVADVLNAAGLGVTTWCRREPVFAECARP